MKLHPVYRMIPLSMTLSDLWPGCQGHGILGVEYRRNVASYRQSHHCTV